AAFHYYLGCHGHLRASNRRSGPTHEPWLWSGIDATSGSGTTRFHPCQRHIALHIAPGVASSSSTFARTSERAEEDGQPASGASSGYSQLGRGDPMCDVFRVRSSLANGGDTAGRRMAVDDGGLDSQAQP